MSAFETPYPDYRVLDKWDSPSWNDQTRAVVRRRLDDIPQRRFLTERQWAVLEAVSNRIVPQPERGHPVEIVPWIDCKLHDNRGPGYRWADLPPMREAWTKGIDSIDAEAGHRHGSPFDQLTGDQQDKLLEDVQNGRVELRLWGDLPPNGFFTRLLLTEIVALYYAHPLAWDEIGFGGPAGPRGYVRLGFDERDPWEAKEIDRDAE